MFYVIGGSNIDLFVKANDDLILRDSNPGKFSFRYGGVARNIACNLANLGEKVCFLSAFGNDSLGKDLIKDLKERHIDISYSYFSEVEVSSLYLAVLDQEDLFLGLNDMSILQKIDKTYLNKLPLNNNDYLVFDTNFSKELIDYILTECRGIKAIDGLSANKVIKLRGIEEKIDILKLNKLEAQALSGQELNEDLELVNYLKSLIKTGSKEVLITGKDYLLIGDNKGIYKYSHNSYDENPVNVTGAGDALFAYYLAGRNKGLSLDDCAKQALRIAVETVESDLTVVELAIDKENPKFEIRKETMV